MWAAAGEDTGSGRSASHSRSPGVTTSQPGDATNSSPDDVPAQTSGESPGPASTATSSAPAGVGTPAGHQVRPRRPTELVLSTNTEVPVTVSRTGSDGLLEIPTNVRRAGWWDGSAKLGDPLGSIVIAAHVDSLTQGLGVFAQLLSAHPGDHVTLNAGRLNQRYTVVRARLVPKASLRSTSPLYSAPSQPRLVLITCGGAFDPARGGYQDNFVVVAVPDGPLAGT